MILNIPREISQIVSVSSLITGLSLMTMPAHFAGGIAMIGVSCWVMLMSESLLLSKVQNEMTIALEALRKKQEVEVQDLLFYLRQSELGNNPWSNVDAARCHIQKIGFPAIITDSGGACVAVNPALYDALGYGEEHIGKLCHGLQAAESYGRYVQGISINIAKGKRFMHSRLTMIDVDGGEHVGTVAITMLPDMRTAVGIWYSDEDAILKS